MIVSCILALQLTGKQKIILLSTSANIVSKHTAFVGVDSERPEKVEGEREQRDVPLPKVNIVGYS